MVVAPAKENKRLSDIRATAFLLGGVMRSRGSCKSGILFRREAIRRLAAAKVAVVGLGGVGGIAAEARLEP